MEEPSLGRQLRTLGRFYRFTLPHWRLILLAFFSTAMVALISGGAVLLIKPIFDGLASADTATVGEPAQLPAEDGDEGAPQSFLERLGEDVKELPYRLSSVRKLREYVGPGPDQLKHVAYLFLFALMPLWVFGAFVEDYASRRVLWSVMADLRITVFEKLTRMPLSFFSSARTGDLISRLTNDISVAHNAVRLMFSDVLRYPVLVAVLFTVAVWYNWQLTLIVVGALPLATLVLRRFGSRIQKHGRKSLERLGDVTDAISQLFGGIRVVKAFGAEADENAQFRETNRRQLQRAFRLVRNQALASAVPQLVMLTAMGLILLLGDYLLFRGRIEVGELMTVVGAVFAMQNPARRLIKSYNNLRASMAAMDRLFEITDLEVRIQDAPDAVDLDGVREGIRFNRVWFAYRDEDYVLRDVDLLVPRGTTCAVVGETGAGKSSMLDLIPRFYDTARGSVEIDGVPVRRIKKESLLGQIAMVGQHPFLFNRSIEENIRYGRRDATGEQVEAAARAANIHQFLAGLPEGYETMAGERGGRLSGGQRQCITIARALLKDAPILILDEATSNLDSESERMVQQALANLMRGRTTFVIAHRLSTVRFADMIVVLKAGRIVEQGTHQELIARDGEYAKLYRLQFAEPPGGAAAGSSGGGERFAPSATGDQGEHA